MIGKIIQTKRKENGLTQAQLADALGVSAPAVNKWEKDLCFPDAELLAPLARILRTDLNELFSFYTLLSDKERQLIVDEIARKFLKEDSESGFAYIKEVLKQNPTDGLLYQDIADELYSLHLLAKAHKPDLYLREIAEYYERALELAPESTDEIACSLMNVYSEMGDRKNAETAWERITESKYDKAWTHAEMLFNLKDYSDATTEIKESILRKVIALARNLSFLSENLKLSGDEELSNLALEKSNELRAMFGLWEGIHIADRLNNPDKPSQILRSLVESCDATTELSSSPLFKNIPLMNKDETADLMSELLQIIKTKEFGDKQND